LILSNSFLTIIIDSSSNDNGEINSGSIDESVSSDSKPGPISYPESVLKKYGMSLAKVEISKKDPMEPN